MASLILRCAGIGLGLRAAFSLTEKRVRNCKNFKLAPNISKNLSTKTVCPGTQQPGSVYSRRIENLHVRVDIIFEQCADDFSAVGELAYWGTHE